jgi:hypothetical protein
MNVFSVCCLKSNLMEYMVGEPVTSKLIIYFVIMLNLLKLDKLIHPLILSHLCQVNLRFVVEGKFSPCKICRVIVR